MYGLLGHGHTQYCIIRLVVFVSNLKILKGKKLILEMMNVFCRLTKMYRSDYFWNFPGASTILCLYDISRYLDAVSFKDLFNSLYCK